MNLDNSRNATEYISEAYAKELAAIKAKAELLETPADIIEKEKVSKTFAMAQNVLDRDILSSEVTEEYQKLLDDIKAKKEELNKLYGIENDKDALKAIKNAAVFVAAKFSEELSEKENNFNEILKKAAEDANTEIETANEEIDTQVREINEKKKTTVAAAAQEAERESAEYDYDLARTRKQADEERAKFVAEREKALALKEEETKKSLQECIDKLKEINDLQAQVDSIPEKLEIAREEGAAAKEKELGKEYGYQKYLNDKDNENAINDLMEELQGLEKKYDALCQEKSALAAALEDYNAKNYQLAVDTAKSVGGINIVNSDNHQYGNPSKK